MEVLPFSDRRLRWELASNLQAPNFQQKAKLPPPSAELPGTPQADATSAPAAASSSLSRARNPAAKKFAPPPPPPPPPSGLRHPPSTRPYASHLLSANTTLSMMDSPQERDAVKAAKKTFILDRFLPAAQAATSHPMIHYGSIAAAAAAAARRRQQAAVPQPSSPPPTHQAPALHPFSPLPTQQALVTGRSSVGLSTYALPPPAAPAGGPNAGHQHHNKVEDVIMKACEPIHSSEQRRRDTLKACEPVHSAEQRHHDKAYDASSLKSRGLVRNAEHRQQDKVEDVSLKSCGFFCIGLKTAMSCTHRSVATPTSSVSKPNNKVLPSQSAKVAHVATLASSDEAEALIKEVKAKLHGRRNCESKLQLNLHFGAPKTTKVVSSTPQCGTSSRDRPLQDQTGGRIAHDNNAGGSSKSSPLHYKAGSRTPEFTPPVIEEVYASSGCVPTGTTQEDSAAGSSLRDRGSSSHERIEVDDDELQFHDALSRFSHHRSISGHSTYSTKGALMSPQCNGSLGCPADWINDEADFADASSQFPTPPTSIGDFKCIASDLTHVREEWDSGTPSDKSKSSHLSERVGQVLRVDTGGKQQVGLQDMDKDANNVSGNQHPPVVICPIKHQVELGTESLLTMMKEKTRKSASHTNAAPAIFPAKHQVELGTESLLSMVKEKTGKSASDTNSAPAIFPAKCQKRAPTDLGTVVLYHDFGWPFGISGYHSQEQLESSYKGQPINHSNTPPTAAVPSPPLPPCPSDSWLEKAITQNALKTSPLATLQKAKEASLMTKKTLERGSTDTSDTTKWEVVVKGSNVQPGHLRFSEELHHHHPSNLNQVKPLRL